MVTWIKISLKAPELSRDNNEGANRARKHVDLISSKIFIIDKNIIQLPANPSKV